MPELDPFLQTRIMLGLNKNLNTIFGQVSKIRWKSRHCC